MRQIVISDPADVRANLLPMTYVRPVAGLRVGIDTLADKWRSMLPGDYSWRTVDYLQPKYALDASATTAPHTLYISGDVVATPDLVGEVLALQPGMSLVDRRGEAIAHCGSMLHTNIETAADPIRIQRLYDIFLYNGRVLTRDFERLTAAVPGKPLSPTVTVIGDPALVYVHPHAAYVEGCTINTLQGPVYIGPHATVMEGSCLRGPLAICDHATVNMGARIYGDTTIGPHCKVGGELNNVVMQAYSNKGHDGFLGNAVIGEWCNIGAGASASNLKNDYTDIKLWNYPARRFVKTGLQFCGLIMGDHSKVGVNAMLNTATVLGVGVNIHGSGFPRPFLASFIEGSTQGFTDVPMAKFFDTARRMMARRDVTLTDDDIAILTRVRELAEQYR